MDASCGETNVTKMPNSDYVKILGDMSSGWFDADGSYYESLLSQLRKRIYERPPRSPGEPGSGAKPKSSPPLDVVALDIYDASVIEVAIHATGDDAHASCQLVSLYRQTRRYLGYEPRMVELTKVCGACGNKLIVAEDASSHVYCTNDDCDVIYRQEDWIALLYAGDDIT